MFGRNLLAPVVFSLAIVLLTGCGPTTVGQVEKKYNSTQLTPEQVLHLVEGNTLLFVSFNEDSYFYFDRSSRLYGFDLYKNKDIGKWDVADTGELCMKLQHWWYGDLKCFTLYPAGEKYAVINSSGVVAFNATHYEGDYKNQYYEPQPEKQSYRQ